MEVVIMEDFNKEYETKGRINFETKDVIDMPVKETELNFSSFDNDESTNEENKKIELINITTKKKKSNFKRNLAIGLGVVLCGTSVGFGVGLGINTSKNIIKSTAKPFAFESSTTETADNVKPISLTASTNSVAEIIKTVKDSVVNISITAQSTNFFNQITQSSGSGSGIIYSQDDSKVYIVTNDHVIDGASTVTISITGEEQIPAKLVGKDAQSDLAVISVLKTDLQSAGIENVTVATFADSDKMEVGEYVFAIGNALGEGKTVTQGIISAQNKTINIDGKKLTVLQTDAAINPGNSGGALVNTNGEVIGINTAKLASSSVEGTGYAIPTSTAQEIIKELMTNGTVEKPYLGIVGFTITDDFLQMYNINTRGVFIQSIEQGSSAAAAGLRATDIITSFNGKQITTIEELSSAISECKINDTVKIGIIRNGVEAKEVTAKLGDLNQSF